MIRKIVLFMAGIASAIALAAQPLLIPQPQSVELRDGSFALTPRTGIVAHCGATNVKLLEQYLEEDIHIALHERTGNNHIVLARTESLDSLLGDEGYRLTISPSSTPTTRCSTR